MIMKDRDQFLFIRLARSLVLSSYVQISNSIIRFWSGNFLADAMNVKTSLQKLQKEGVTVNDAVAVGPAKLRCFAPWLQKLPEEKVRQLLLRISEPGVPRSSVTSSCAKPRMPVAPSAKFTKMRKTSSAPKTAALEESSRAVPRVPTGPKTQHQIDDAFLVLMRVRITKKLTSVFPVVQALRTLKAASDTLMDARWTSIFGNLKTLPRQRMATIADLTAKSGVAQARVHTLEYGLYKRFYAWKSSVDSYVSALSLWGELTSTLKWSMTDPGNDAVEVFSTLFNNGDSLTQYLSHLRGIYSLLQVPMGALCASNSRSLVKGSCKLTPNDAFRIKQAVSAKQMRALVRWLRGKNLIDMADSFVVARQYALRFKSECVAMQWNGESSRVECTNKQVTLHTTRKTTGKRVVPICRGCICSQQGSELCGYCILRRRSKQNKSGFVFPRVTYASGLYWLRQAAEALGWPLPSSWGTHAFRRGWGRDAFRSGGLSALFVSGGWKGLAATAYVAASQISEVEACNFCVDYSDEEEPW